MRILQLINRVPWPLKDGGSIMYYQYIKGYHEAGCEVTVAALNTSKHFIEQIPDELSSIAQFHTVFIDNRVKPIPAFLNLFSSRSYNVERFISHDFEILLADLLNRNTYDVVVCESVFMAHYINVIRSNSNALCVLRQHNVEYHIWQTMAANENNPVKKWYLNLLAKRLELYEQKMLNSFDVIAAVTESDKQEFERMGFEKPIYVAPMGVDVVKNQTEPVLQSFFHLGSMEWEPNKEAVYWFVKDIWPNIVKQFPKAKLYLAGRNMDNQMVLPFTEGIEILGEIDDAAAFISKYQIMIVPLLSGSGIRVKILEGMAAGKAIISTSLGARGIQYTNGQHLMIADTADEFCQSAIQLLNNPLFCNSLGYEAQKLMEAEYSNTKVINETLRFFSSQIKTGKTAV